MRRIAAPSRRIDCDPDPRARAAPTCPTVRRPRRDRARARADPRNRRRLRPRARVRARLAARAGRRCLRPRLRARLRLRQRRRAALAEPGRTNGAPRRVPRRRIRLRPAGGQRRRTRRACAARSSIRSTRYDYFARPVKLVPNTAAALPQITDGGRTYTIRVRPGIFFPPRSGVRRQAARAHRRRLRLQHQARRSTPRFARTGSTCSRNGSSASTSRWRGRAGPGRSTTTRRSRACRCSTASRCACASRDPDYAFQHWLTTNYFAAVAREVVEAKKDESNRVMEDPVGTGPYRLAEWRRASASCSRRTRTSATSAIPRPAPMPPTRRSRAG